MVPSMLRQNKEYGMTIDALYEPSRARPRRTGRRGLARGDIDRSSDAADPAADAGSLVAVSSSSQTASTMSLVAYIVMAYIVLAYIDMACIVMA